MTDYKRWYTTSQAGLKFQNSQLSRRANVSTVRPGNRVQGQAEELILGKANEIRQPRPGNPASH